MADETPYLEQLQAYADKIDSPERLAQFQTFGAQHYADAAFLNLLKNATIEFLQNGAVDQDNIDIVIQVKIYDSALATPLSKINTLNPFTVNDKESVLFRVPYINTARVTYRIDKYKMLNKGKGTYGAGGTQLEQADLELVYSGTVTTGDVIYPSTQTIAYGSLSAQTIVQWVNTHSPALALQNQENGYVVFKGTINGVETDYLFLGDGGTYGTGHTSVAASDFQLLAQTPVVTIPTIDQVLASGNETQRASIHLDPDTGSKASYAFNRRFFGPTGKTVTETFENPQANVAITIPAHKQDTKYVLVAPVNTIDEIVFPAAKGFFEVAQDTLMDGTPQTQLYFSDGTAQQYSDLIAIINLRVSELLT
jgi:hypothetical protein